jgi:VanZ family protein
MTPIRITTWSAVLMIVVLSVVPGDLRPHVLADKHIEHLGAYFVTGCLSALAYPQLRHLFVTGALLATCAAVLELVQLEIPGRTSSITDFAVSACGACLGLLLAFILKQALAEVG